MILFAGVLVGIGRVAVVEITSTVMNPLVPELVAIVVAIGREGGREGERERERERERGTHRQPDGEVVIYTCITMWSMN